jgi:ABC-type transport system substrate-binding protein
VRARRWRRLLAVTLVMLAGGACSGGGGGDGRDGRDSTPTTTSPATTTTAPSDTPRPGGVLRVGILRPHTLDPASAFATVPGEVLAADLLFDSLTVVPAGADSAVPSLASSWTVSADQKVWTFVLRDDAVFSNGRAITATDVKYSLERVARQGEASLTAIRLEVISGYGAFLLGAPDLAGVKAVDDQTVEIDLDLSLSALPELLANPLYGVVPREAVEAAAPTVPFAQAPAAGSGAFRYGSTTGDVLHLIASAPGPALLDGVDLVQYDDEAAAYADFGAGGLDVAPVPSEQVDDAIASVGDGGFVPGAAESFYAMNMRSPTFADARFRQAISRAIDRDSIVRTVYGSVAVPLSAIVPEGVPGHVANPCAPSVPCTYDPDAARALVAAAFPPGGRAVPTVNIDFPQTATEEGIAGIVKTNLEAVGIPAVLRPHPFEEFRTFAVSGQQELFQFGWPGLYQSPEAYLGPLFSSSSADNATSFSDPAVDLLLAAARAEGDVPARLDDYTKVEQAVLAQAPIVPIAQFRTRLAIADDVRDLVVVPDGTFAAEVVWLDR